MAASRDTQATTRVVRINPVHDDEINDEYNDDDDDEFNDEYDEFKVDCTPKAKYTALR